jgi:hypothetical protein
MLSSYIPVRIASSKKIVRGKNKEAQRSASAFPVEEPFGSVETAAI